MFERDRHVEEIYDDHEYQKDANIENYDIDIPGQVLQPINNAESAQELNKVLNNIIRFPFLHHLPINTWVKLR